MTPTEAQLDTVLADALSDRGEFSTWFLRQTRFGHKSAQCVLCRSNNPWSSVRFQLPNEVTGELESLARDCETDVLAVYETPDGRRLALHIENKLAGGSFTQHQAILYRERLQQWKHRTKLGNYVDATSVLVAPQVFFDLHRTDAETFETFISHEALAKHLSVFGWTSRTGA